MAAAFGPGRTFLAGLVLGGVMSLVQALMPGFWLFAGTRAVEGLAHLALVVGGPPLMAAAAFEVDRGRVDEAIALYARADETDPLDASAALEQLTLEAPVGEALERRLADLMRRYPHDPRIPAELSLQLTANHAVKDTSCEPGGRCASL